MKIFPKFVLCCLLVFLMALSCYALCEVQPSDKAYEEGKTYRLIEETVDLTGIPVYAPAHALEELGLDAENQEGLVQIGVYEELFKDASLTLKYASRNLDTLMFTVGNGEGIVCLRNGRLIVTAPSYTRGAEDAYGVFDFIANSREFYALATRNGMIFSPDGRYAVYVNSARVLQMVRLEYQLIILDVEAGEWYLGYTWPAKIMQGGEAVLSACFDENGESILIRAYGNAYSARNSLLRYDIKTGDMKHVLSHEFDVDYTNLLKIPGGFVHGTMQMKANNPSGIIIYKETAQKLVPTAHYFHIPQSSLSIQHLDVNSKTGQALIIALLQLQNPDASADSLAASVSTIMNGLILPVLNDGVDHLQELILFDKHLTQAKRVSFTDYSEFIHALDSDILTYPALSTASLSPDGKYAFLTFSEVGDMLNSYARILNTQTLSLSNVEFDEGVITPHSIFSSGYSAQYPIGANFIANDLVLINTKEGVKLFRIQ